MQSLTDYPDHWLERAENADHLAKEMDDPDAKRGMQDVAEAYRRIAQRSAWREVTPCARERHRQRLSPIEKSFSRSRGLDGVFLLWDVS